MVLSTVRCLHGVNVTTVLTLLIVAAHNSLSIALLSLIRLVFNVISTAHAQCKKRIDCVTVTV